MIIEGRWAGGILTDASLKNVQLKTPKLIEVRIAEGRWAGGMLTDASLKNV